MLAGTASPECPWSGRGYRCSVWSLRRTSSSRSKAPGHSTDASSAGCWRTAPGHRQAVGPDGGGGDDVSAITIGSGAHASSAARLMTENGIKRLPVVDADGTLIGIVTRADLVRAFARPDAEIEHEIREDVMYRTLWLEQPGVTVRVEEGEVRLAGKLERRSDAELLERFVAWVPGIVRVNSTLRWSWDDGKAGDDDNAFDPRRPTRSTV